MSLDKNDLKRDALRSIKIKIATCIKSLTHPSHRTDSASVMSPSVAHLAHAAALRASALSSALYYPPITHWHPDNLRLFSRGEEVISFAGAWRRFFFFLSKPYFTIARFCFTAGNFWPDTPGTKRRSRFKRKKEFNFYRVVYMFLLKTFIFVYGRT